MKKLFSILTFIALAMVIASFLATTPSGLAAIGKVLSLDGDRDYVKTPVTLDLTQGGCH
jgi:hypothetical protein